MELSNPTEEASVLRSVGAPTLRDVARRAGVARMTASRAISGNGYVAEETRAAVMAAVKELGYRPHMSARSMKQNRSHSVGVLVQNNPQLRFTHPLAWEFILGINEGLEQSGYMTSLIRFDDVAEDGGFSAKAFEGHLLDGLIAVNYFPADVESCIWAATPRCVWLDGNVWEEANCIRRDEAWAGALAVRELAKLGYREIVAVRLQPAETPTHHSYYERWQGAQEAARECGVELREWLKPQHEDGRDYSGLLPQIRRERAVLMMDNYHAHALIMFLAGTSLRVGHDFALACCDDDFQNSAYHRDGLSRVGFDRFALGGEAAAMLLQSIESGAPVPSRLVRHEWIVGDTALPLRPN